jgi:hypothetical protein
MRENTSAAIEVIEEHGSFLLIRAGSRFAVIEKRAERIYPMKPGEREGIPMTPEGMRSLVAEEGALGEADARRLFNELCDRGERLAQHLW